MGQEREYFESNMTSDERELDALLSHAMNLDEPKGLSNRVWQESKTSLGETQMDLQLDQAYGQQTPANLPQRIFASSVSELQREETLPTIARIGGVARWQQAAIAAGLLLTTLIAIRFGLPQQPEITKSMLATSWQLSVEEESLLLDDLELSQYTYLADTRELAFADVADSFNSVRQDIELWQYGLLTE